MDPYLLSRRRFIGNACAAVGATGVLSALAQLRMIGAAAADSSTSTDFKALVCLFLYGGNDSNNVLIPTDASDYAAYAAQRTALAIPQGQLLPITPRTTDGRSWGLHPSLAEVQGLFNQGGLAVLANTGTLVQPVTLAQYNAGTVALPPQLFSHADQQVQWQSSIPDQPFQTGWGGRTADLINAINSNPKISMSISVAGENSFQVGNVVSQFAVNPSGAVTVSGSTGGSINPARFAAEQNILNQQDVNLFQAAFGGVTNSAIGASTALNSVLANAVALKTKFPSTSLGTELQMIAKLISVSAQLGLKRQIFFASLGGWDLHSGELPAHATLLQQLSQGLSAFSNATAELGLSQQVTTFTASDFSRTFNTNGDGSDHGWGSHHLIMGGAVQGRQIYGQLQNLTIGGPDDTGRGRWIPTTSVDQYAATLASWFGVSATNLPVVLPNIGRFATANLGFMG
ncbi:MAG TPA: DUF1501 domain-containing protein [Opitutaceae bacterium]|jgi:uncharacterized protein (DUF1501 family)|nr:DUF1501 domain-containing protein [Opitutaceae bacterium]